jgi:DNA-binding NarL/FixJ family response regulator
MRAGAHTAEKLAWIIRACPAYEKQVIVMAVQGRTDAEIAEVMGHREDTIRDCKAAILPQLQLDSWDAGMFTTRQVRRALDKIARHYGLEGWQCTTTTPDS